MSSEGSRGCGTRVASVEFRRACQGFTAGDHDIFAGEMVRARVADGAPLIHFASHYRRLA